MHRISLATQAVAFIPLNRAIVAYVTRAIFPQRREQRRDAMLKALRKFPWFEVILIVGLAVALINKPQSSVLSATSDSAASAVSTAVTTTQSR